MDNKKKVLILSNIKNDYKTKFFNSLSDFYNITVIYEGMHALNIKFNESKGLFKEIFLKRNIIEKKVNFSITKYLFAHYDYIFVTNIYTYTSLFSILTLIIFNIKYLLIIDGGKYKSSSRLKSFIKKILFSKAELIFSPSEISDQYLILNGAKKNLIKRYNFSSLYKNDILRNPLTVRGKLNLKKRFHIQKSFTLLFVGQFIYRKGIDILVELSKHLNFRHNFILIGKQRKVIDSVISKIEFPNNFTLLNFMSQSELNSYFAFSDVFILPSREEFWGLVVNEALSNGLPVITTTECVAGLTLIKNFKNGFLFDLQDIQGLINFLNDKNNRINLLSSSKESLKSVSNFNIEYMTKQIVAELKKLN
jgi:glycosyltransferase involved in cell wall biosynthesis